MKEKTDLMHLRGKEYSFFIKGEPCRIECYEIEDEEEAARISAKHYYDKLASIPRRKHEDNSFIRANSMRPMRSVNEP